MNAPTLPVHQPLPLSTPTLVAVEISTIDQHGDPGFVHSRGFHSPAVAARFALTQSVVVAEMRGLPAVAVTITNTESASADTDVCVIGTPGEIACALAVHPLYALGVRRAELQAPDLVYSAAREAAAAGAIASPGGDAGTFVEVVVRSVRPHPLPDSTEARDHHRPDREFLPVRLFERKILMVALTLSPFTATWVAVLRICRQTVRFVVG